MSFEEIYKLRALLDKRGIPYIWNDNRIRMSPKGFVHGQGFTIIVPKLGLVAKQSDFLGGDPSKITVTGDLTNLRTYARTGLDQASAPALMRRIIVAWNKKYRRVK